MDTRLKGIHHITLCPAGAQEDVDFFTTVLGLRLVKQTVLMDGSIPVYHFYYGNADADPGSILTCFPYDRRPGRRGTGQIGITSFSVNTNQLVSYNGQLAVGTNIPYSTLDVEGNRTSMAFDVNEGQLVLSVETSPRLRAVHRVW